MIWQSIPLMTTIDIVIIAITGGCAWMFARHRPKISEQTAVIGQAAIVFGLVITMLFYLSDLLAMHVMPLFVPFGVAMAAMETLHLEYQWFAGLLGTGSIALGFTIMTRVLVATVETQSDSERKVSALNRTLMESEAQMRLVTDAIPALIAYFDSAQRLQFANKTFEDWYAAPRSEIVGNTIEELMADYVSRADFERFRPHVEAALSGEDVRFEELVTYPDGNTRNIWVTYVPERAPDGSAKGVFALIQDITGRKRMEDAVRESEATLNTIIANAPNAISLKDTRGRYILINRVFEELLGVTNRMAVGKTSPELFPKAFAESGIAHDRAIVDSGAVIEREEVLELANESRTYLTTKFPIRDAAGEIVSIGAIHTDITERKKAENRLKESEERLRQAVRLAKIGQYVWDDVNDAYLYVDPEYAEIFGLTTDEFHSALGTVDGYLGWVHPDDRERYNDVVFAGGREFRGEIDIHYRIVKRDGDVRHVHELGIPNFDHNGALIRTIGTAQDVTEQRAFEVRRHEAERLEAIGQLTGGVAHEFNNLLQIIVGSLEVIEQDVEGLEPAARMIANARTSAFRGRELTARLLSYVGKQVLTPEVTDVRRFVTEIADLLTPMLGGLIEVDTRVADDLWSIDVDADQLQSAFFNLATNARDAMPDGGRLSIECANVTIDPTDSAARMRGRAPGDFVRIRFADNGVGMTPAVRERAFDPFFTTKEVGKGTGLGLSMVYGFVTRQSGGFVDIEDAQGGGTIVALYLPRSTVPAGETPEVKPRRERRTGRSGTILVIEDNAAVRGATMFMLEKLGYTALGAETGADALDLLGKHEPIDVVLSDVVMPGRLRGKRLVEAIKAASPTTKVIMMSGYSEEELTAMELWVGGVHLLSKPFLEEELIAALDGTAGATGD